jgi:hypothetical protein
MTVAFLPSSGDKGDTVTVAGVAPVCPFPAPRHPQCVAAERGSRFWALVEDSSDDDDDAAPVRSFRSPRSPLRPPPVTVGDFLSEAFANPSASFVRAGRHKGSAFASRHC